jgi:hypothetical protein
MAGNERRQGVQDAFRDPTQHLLQTISSACLER